MQDYGTLMSVESLLGRLPRLSVGNRPDVTDVLTMGVESCSSPLAFRLVPANLGVERPIAPWTAKAARKAAGKGGGTPKPA